MPTSLDTQTNAKRGPDLDGLGAWCLGRPIGTTAVLMGANAAEARAALMAAEAPQGGRAGLVFDVPCLAPAEALVQSAVHALNTAALHAFPRWYGVDIVNGIGMTTADDILVTSRLRDVLRHVPEVAPIWAERAIRRMRAGWSPRVPGSSVATEIRQFSLALAPSGLTLLPVAEHPPTEGEGSVFAHGLEWLAVNSGSAVVALMPEVVARVPAELSRLEVYTIVRPTPGETADDDVDRSGPWIGPIIGQPHWASQAEQRLAAGIKTDPMLAPLFGYNQSVETIRGTRPRVDLFWPVGRVVVEIDGFADHGTREAFRRDRQRDYELLVSGYVVLRVTAAEVLTDLPMTLAKIREVIRLRNKRIGHEQW